MARPLVIVGTGGLAREVAALVEKINAEVHRWEVLGFVGERGCEVGKELGGLPIFGDDDWFLKQSFEADVVVAVGYPSLRADITKRYQEKGQGRLRFPTLVHPAAIIESKRLKLGDGNILTAGVYVSCDVTIGCGNLVNWYVTIGHDVEIGDFCVINPGANISGYVRLGDRVMIGTGARVLEGVQIGADAVIGAGAVVTKDVAPGETVIGVPARPMRKVQWEE